MRNRINHALCAAAVSALTALMQAQAFANDSLRPDALLQIDMNRTAVVERIIGSWGKEIPSAQLDSFKSKLMGLRADQLLAANLSGSFDGVLEVMDAHEKASARVSSNAALSASSALPASAALEANGADRSKAVGELDRDLVYTPITPCRFLDTRGSFSPVFAGGAFTPSQIRTYQATGNCGIPTGAQAVVTQIIMITPTAAGDIEVLPQGVAFGNTAAMVFQANVFSSVSLIARLNSTNGQFSTQIRGPGGNVAMDVTGYFMPPSRNGDGLRVIATTNGLPNVINGDSSNTITAPSTATISGGQNNTTTGVASTIAGGQNNDITGASSSATASVISGGENNTANGDRNVIAGGGSNVTSSTSSTVGGGVLNQATGTESTIPGGRSNLASGFLSFAAGNRAKAINDGAFVWSDSSGFNHSSTAVNQFSARATGGFRFVTAIDGAGAPTKTFAIAPTTGNVTTPGRIDATDDIASAADVTASGNVSAGVDLLATRNVTATQNVVANNKLVASRNQSSATGTKAIGDRFRDNSIIAWASIQGDGTLVGATTSFGITSVTKTAVGSYRIVVDVAATFPASNLVPVAIAELASPPSSAATLRIVSINQNTNTSFDVFMSNGLGAPVDNRFTVIVTGR
jgi:hypothetical protein